MDLNQSTPKASKRITVAISNVPGAAALAGEATSSSNFNSFSEFLLSKGGLGAFTGGETGADSAGVAVKEAGVGSKLGTN